LAGQIYGASTEGMFMPERDDAYCRQEYARKLEGCLADVPLREIMIKAETCANT